MVVTLAGIATGCAFEPNGAEPIDAPPAFREWWDKTEACSERRGDFDRIEWYVVPGNAFNCPTGQCVGRWESNHKIYLSSSWQHDEMVVRHEMLHELIGRAGHPDPPFGAECPLTWQTWPGSVQEFARSGNRLSID
jgi:hypothetical protein